MRTYRISVPNGRRRKIVYLFRAISDQALARELDKWPTEAVADPVDDQEATQP